MTSALSVSLVVSICIFLTAWYILSDGISCRISDAEILDVDGFYTTFGGMYLKRGHPISYNPDIFDLLNLRKSVFNRETMTISFSKQLWTVGSSFRKKIHFKNEPLNPSDYLSSPPETGWINIETGQPSKMRIYGCVGSLQDSPPINNDFTKTNIGQLIAIPITTSLLALIIYIAYYLWAYRVDVAAVASSYDGIVNRNEYYRIITATMSHFDIMHLGFNTMSLYQLGKALESSQYSSMVYLYSSVNLIFLTIGAEMVILYALIKQYNRVDLIPQLAVGYSGVLFAWMVAASVRMSQFCPIFLFPSLCFTTYHIPIPEFITGVFLSEGPVSLPVNIGPFILLLITKIIIPRSSFLGHLSGILIGYPLAWNGLNWLIPPVMVSFLTLFYVVKENLWLHNIPTTYTAELSEFVPLWPLRMYYAFTIVAVVLVLLECAAVMFFGPFQVLVRFAVISLLVCAVFARKYEFTHTLTSVHDVCVKIMGCLLVNLTCLWIYDTATFAGTLYNQGLIIGCGIDSDYQSLSLIYTGMLIFSELLCIVLVVLNLYDIPAARGLLTTSRLDKVSVERDLGRLGIMYLIRGSVSSQAFSGTGNRLSGPPPTATSTVATMSATSSSNNSISSSPHYKGTIAMAPMAVKTNGAVNSLSGADATSNSNRGVYTNLNRESPGSGANCGPVARTPSPSAPGGRSAGNGKTNSKGSGKVFHV